MIIDWRMKEKKKLLIYNRENKLPINIINQEMKNYLLENICYVRII